MDKSNSAQQTYRGEIDLFEFFAQIWKSKLLILLITATFATLGIAYSLLSTPVYHSQAVLTPPSPKNLVEIRKIQAALKQAGHESTKVTPQSIFSEFIARLNSNRYKNSFLEHPDLQEYFRKGNTSQLQARERFKKSLTISIPKKPPYSQVTLFLETNSENLSSKWLNEYIEYAHARFKAELTNNIESQISATKNNLKLTIQSKKENYLSSLKEQISNLEEALLVANEIGLIEPLRTDATFHQEDLVHQLRSLYQLGSKSLSAELKALRARLKDNNNATGLSDEKLKLEILSNINIQSQSISALTVDLAAETNATPLKPKPFIIITLSILIGGIAGILYSLFKNAMNNRRRH